MMEHDLVFLGNECITRALGCLDTCVFFVLWLALLQSVSILEIIVFVICALVAIADCIAGCVPEYGVY